jgi:hypothetical protein
MQLVQCKPAVQTCVLVGACLWIFGGRALAGGSLLVDDAAVTPAGHCQLEAWARTYSPGQILATVSACTYAGKEYSVGVSEFLDPRSDPPSSFDLDTQHRRRAHTNLGWRDSGTAGRGAMTGLGIELPCTARSPLLTEVYVQPDHFRLGELGWRPSLTDAASVDRLLGHQASRAGTAWFTTVGISVPLP